MAADADLDQAYDIIGRDQVPAPAPRPNDSLEQRIDELRKWLQPTDYLSPGDEFMKHLHSYAPGTGRWAQESPVFREWVGEGTDTAPPDGQAQSSCLHVRGVAGTGKSVFSASIIRKLQESAGIVLFFFFRQIVEKHHTAKYLVRDFAAQLLPHCPALVASLTVLSQDHAVGGNEMDLVWPALTEALAEESSDGVNGRVYCVVDALDEMDDDDFEDMVQKLVALGTQRPEAVRVMMTSRPLPKIEQELRELDIVQLKLDTSLLSTDVALYVDFRMAALEPPLTNEKNQLVKETICECANGLFLHARLVADDLAEGLRDGRITEETLPDSLESLPRSLHEVYENMLKEHARRSGVTSEQQAKILMCVTHASRPMRVIELASLLSCMLNLDLRRGKELVRAGCGRLLEILQDETVSVIHHSFTEFLHDASRKDSEDVFPVLDDVASHAMLAVLSLEYLNSCPRFDTTIDDSREANYDEFEFGDEEDTRRRMVRADVRVDHPLVSYAINNLIFHLDAAATGSIDHILTALDCYFAPGKPAYEMWMLFEWNGRLSASVNVFHLATAVGHDVEMPIYVLAHFDSTRPGLLDAPDLYGRTPLAYAARFGHEKIVEFLLSAGADPTLGGKDGKTPLHLAVMEMRPGAVRLLLDAGVDPLIKTWPVLKEYSTRDAMFVQYTAEEAEARRETALCYAFRWDDVEVTKAFMPFIPPAEINWCFHQARKVQNIKALLDTGKVDINSFQSGMTKLSRAADSRDLGLIKLLLQHGADPNRRSARDRDAWKDEDVKLEIAEIDAKKGPAPLHVLSSCRYRLALSARDKKKAEECVRTLVDAGADVNLTADERFREDGETLTPLHHAVQKAAGVGWGWGSPDRAEEILTEVLLSAGADPSAKSKNGDTPLHLANPEKPSLLEALVKHGADINAKNARGRTPLLEIISRMGHVIHSSSSSEPSVAIVDKLLELGADVNAADNDGDTILHHFMHSVGNLRPSMRSALAQRLLDAGVVLNKKNDKGQPPLWRYNHCGFHAALPIDDDDEVLRLLVDAGLDINARDVQGQTILWPLLGQSVEGLTVIKKFVRLGADPSVSCSNGSTLLHASINSMSPPEVVQYLISAGAALDAPGMDGDNLIHSVLRLTHHSTYAQEVIPFLIEVGIPPLAKNEKRQSALHATGSKHNLKFVLEYPAFKELDINGPDIEGWSPLHFAARLGDHAVAMLLEHGADLTALTPRGLSPLHVAVRTGQAGAVCLLLAKYRECGVLERQVNFLGEGRAPLHYACQFGRPETVLILLQNGADPWLTDENGLTPLHATAEFAPLEWQNWMANPTRTAEIIRMFERTGMNLDAKVSLQVDGDEAKTTMASALDLAVEKKCWQTVRALIECGAVPSDNHKAQKDFVSATDKDIAAQNTRVLRDSLVEDGPQPVRGLSRCWDWLPPRSRFRGRWAVSQEMEILPEEQTDFIDGGKAILDAHDLCAHIAVGGALWDSDYDSIKEYALLGGDVLPRQDNGDTLFHHLVDWGYADLLKNFDEKVSEFEAQKQVQSGKADRGTLLGRACERRLPSVHIIQFLVEQLGVDVNAVHSRRRNYLNPKGTTAAHILAKGDYFWHIEALEYLLSKGGDINARNEHGKTPLLVAIGQTDDVGFWAEQTVRLLLDHGADPNSSVQRTGIDAPGLRAVELSRQPEITKLLLDRGAGVQNCAGLLARASRNWLQPETVRLWLEAGLDPNELPAFKEGHIEDDEDERDIYDERSEKKKEKTEPRYALHEAARPLTFCYTPFDCQRRKEDIVEVLLSHGADPFAQYPDSSFVLQRIVEDHGLLNAFIPRLSQGDLNRKGSHGRSLLISACIPTFPIDPKPRFRVHEMEKPFPTILAEAIHALLDCGADVLATDDMERTPLHWFCTLPGTINDSHRKAFAALVERGPAAINMRDGQGYKPLHLALAAYASRSQKSTFAIRHLIAAGADPGEPEPVTQNSVLHMIAPQLVGEPAAAAEAATFFRELASSLDIEGRNAASETPVFSFAAAGWQSTPRNVFDEWFDVTHAKALDLFLDLGADLSGVDALGSTLLHVTVNRDAGNITRDYDQLKDIETMFKRLMELGVDPRREDQELRTAIDLAAARRLYSIVDLFREDLNLEDEESVLSSVLE